MIGVNAQTPASWPVVLLDNDMLPVQGGSRMVVGRREGQGEFHCLLPILVKPRGITFIPFFTS